MSASLVTERPPTPPRSIDGENSSVEVQPQPEATEPHAPPQSPLPLPKIDQNISQAIKLEDNTIADHEASKAQPGTQDQDHYGDPSLYQTAAPVNNFYPIQSVSNAFQDRMHNASLTPRRQTLVRKTQLQTPPAAYDDDRIHTRSGRALGSPVSPTFKNSSRIRKSPRPKNIPRAAKKSKAPKPGAPLLDGPLSILTKDYNIPVKDMDAWVHRPVSERLEQAAKNKNHISRPMNSFMLYRSAYADRAKHFCRENNHQVVSQVTGASWPLEQKEIREMYEEFARIERDAHHNAHPDYKFAPNKKGATKRNYGGKDDDDDEDPEWEGSKRNRRSQTASSGPGRRSHSSTPFDDRYRSVYHPPIHPSSYWASNPRGQAPMGMGPESYYHPIVSQYSQQVDDVAMRRMQYPQYAHGQVIGLPNNNFPGMIAAQYPEQMYGDAIDPQLDGGEQPYQYAQYETVQPGYEAHVTYEQGTYPVADTQYYEEQPQSLHPGMATLTDGPDGWDRPGVEFDHALERWT